MRVWNLGERVVIAHRAGGAEAPENSPEAFARMHELGFRYMETDAHATKDGVVVLFHDPILDRTTDGHGRIEKKTWAELEGVRDHGGNPLLRLTDALSSYPDFVFNIDAKNNHAVKPLIRAIKDHDALRRVSLASFSETRLAFLRRKLRGASSSLGIAAIVSLWVASRTWWPSRRVMYVPGPRQGVQAVQVPALMHGLVVVDQRFVDEAHRRGLAVHVWTVNDPATMVALLDLGVEGIITDVPSLAKRVIELYPTNPQAAASLTIEN
ncbi:glycerophosphodiester phosphodiesterase family protein [Arcanobacterium wilhelmae]|nr:glycerophosphodiester phosphodiesterase family protein [Arcanobacterium wilhelmae]WFN91159.1 glycerophosphodiester phosphodiesterase family protein [Arcanobacterium wilhelmae]